MISLTNLCRNIKNLQTHTLLKDITTADGYYLIPFMDKDNKITYYTADAIHRGETIDGDKVPKYSKMKKDYVGDAPNFNERYLYTHEPYIFITERTIRRFKY